MKYFPVAYSVSIQTALIHSFSTFKVLHQVFNSFRQDDFLNVCQ
jgi:hypothetical protein